MIDLFGPVHIFSSIPKQGPGSAYAIMDSIVVFQKRSGANALPLESFLCRHPHPPFGTSWHHTRAERPLCFANVSSLFEQSLQLNLSWVPADGPMSYDLLLACRSINVWDLHNLQHQRDSVWLNELFQCPLSGGKSSLCMKKQSWADTIIWKSKLPSIIHKICVT